MERSEEKYGSHVAGFSLQIYYPPFDGECMAMKLPFGKNHIPLLLNAPPPHSS